MGIFSSLSGNVGFFDPAKSHKIIRVPACRQRLGWWLKKHIV